MSQAATPPLTFIGLPWWVRRVSDRIRIPPEARAAGAIAITWLPLLLAVAWDPQRRTSFLHDVPVHTRLLVSIPCLILCERWIAARLGPAVQAFGRSGIIPEDQRLEITLINERVSRLRDTWVLSIILGVAAYALYPLQERAPMWRASGAADLWYTSVSAPLFRFVLLRWLWWIFLWGRWVVSVAKLKLRLPATHPDGKCGLAYLSNCLTSFAWVTFAVGLPVAASAHEMGEFSFVPQGLPSYLGPLALVAGLLVLLIFGPLLALAPAMRVAIRATYLRFTVLTARQSERLFTEWFDRFGEAEIKGQDYMAANDLQSIFVRTQGKTWLPIVPRAMLITAAGAFASAVPFLLMDRQLIAVATKVLKALG